MKDGVTICCDSVQVCLFSQEFMGLNTDELNKIEQSDLRFKSAVCININNTPSNLKL
jgi:hypothetical protein